MREKEKTGVRDELAGLPVDRERLQEFNIILEKYKAGKKRLEKRVVAAEQWWKLRNEAEERKQNIGWDEGFRAKSGWLHNVIISKHADAMESYPEPIILPREPGDQKQAKMLTAVIPVILTQNKFERIYSDVAWQKLKTGTGVYKVTWDADKLGGLGDIDISRVDLLSVFWEPGITDIQKSRYFFHCELQDNELLERQYPQLKDKLKGDVTTLTKFIYDDNVPTDGKSLVVDVYYKLPEGGRTVLHYCKYVGNEVLYSTENEAAGGVPAAEEPEESWQDRVGRMLQDGSRAGHTGGQDAGGGAGMRKAEEEDPSQALRAGSPQRGEPGAGEGPGAAPAPGMPGDGGLSRTPAPTDMGPGPGAAMPGMGAPGAMPGMPGAMPAPVEHHGLYDHGLYPFVFDQLWPVEGSPCGYGYVDLSMNPQIQLDMLDTAFLKNAMVGATPRYFQRIDGAVNENEFLDLKKAIVHVNGTLDEQSLRVIDYKPLAGGYLNFYANKVAELRETSGNTETAQGISSGGVTAASAIAAMQEASGKTSRDSSRASYWAFSDLVNMVIELVRQFYDQPRTFRIQGDGGQEEFALVDNSAMLPQPLGIVNEDMGYRLPVYDIKVEIQKRNAYTRTSQNELALQLYGAGMFNPQLASQTLMCLAMMDFEGKDQLMQKVAQNGTLEQQLQQAQMMVLQLLQRYEPQQAKAFAQQMGVPMTAMGGQAPELGKATETGENSIVSRARDRANQATTPEG